MSLRVQGVRGRIMKVWHDRTRSCIEREDGLVTIKSSLTNEGEGFSSTCLPGIFKGRLSCLKTTFDPLTYGPKNMNQALSGKQAKFCIVP